MLLVDAIDEYEMDCKVRKLSKRSIRNYRVLLMILARYEQERFNVIDLEKVKPIHIKQFILWMEEKGRKPRYVNDLLKVFRTFFYYCIGEQYVTSSPLERIHNVKQPKVLIRTFSEDEIKRMLNYYRGDDYLSIRNRTMLALFFDTGMRLAEVLTLT